MKIKLIQKQRGDSVFWLFADIESFSTQDITKNDITIGILDVEVPDGSFLKAGTDGFTRLHTPIYQYALLPNFVIQAFGENK